ncbi:MAG: type IV pilus biogenesis/stability protein PilW [Pseudomonadales bacterium]|nr:type IV pilus biogenesis/stability protein PilW [Pseudomonadales bacterium]
MSVNRSLSQISTLLLAAMLSACVTTTTGGFTVEPSEEAALDDYVQLAIAYYEADDMAGARRHINNALEISDRNADVYNVLALIFQREGDLDLAEDNFQRAIRYDRANSRVRNNYGALLYSMGRYDDALEQFEIVTRDTMYEGRAIAFENMGRSALPLGRSEIAENAFQRALQLNGNLYIAAVELSMLRADRDDWNGARRVFQQYLTTAQFYNLPHTPRALLAGIRIEGKFQNQELVRDFTRILTTLYRESPEYQAYLRLSDVN